MSRFGPIVLALLLAVASPCGATPDDCTPAARDLEARAAALVDRGEAAAAVELLRTHFDELAACRPAAVAAWSLRAWVAASAAGAQGGTPEALADATPALATLATLGPAVSEAGYAAALVHAAIVAAQDERDELQVWLEQARDVSTRLSTNGAAPRWPLPLARAEGELWLAVDDFELAEDGFRRAADSDGTAASFRGLARVRDRRGNRAGACAAYREVVARAPGTALAAEARGYLLLCDP